MIHPVILCGGSGTRLWPLSRKEKPKPFLPLIGEGTLFQQALARVSNQDVFADPIVVAGQDHVRLIEEQLGDTSYRLIVEPVARNTAPAIALAASVLPSDAIMLVCPSDHYIADQEAFAECSQRASRLAEQDFMVSFGIAPTRPETGYGYLLRGEAMDGGFAVARFVEKPTHEKAREYLTSGKYAWNGGIFAFRAGAVLAELHQHRPLMAGQVGQAVAQGENEGSRFLPAPVPFAEIEGDSIDFAVMENTSRAAMVPVEMGWSDIGNWAALHEALAARGEGTDADGNIVEGAVDLAQCHNVFARSDGPRVSAVGIEDICIVVADGEILVTSRDGAQLVGKLPGARDQ